MFVFRAISRLPISLLYIFSDVLYLIMCYVIQYRKKVIESNLFYAFPEKSPAERKEIKRKFYRNFTDSLAETVKLLTISEEDLAKRIKIVNVDLVLEKINNGELIIGLTSHFFNWEAHLLAIQALVQQRCEVVYQKVNNQFFENLMHELRGRFGGKLVERKKDRKSTRLNSSHVRISYAVFCLKKKKEERKKCRCAEEKDRGRCGWDVGRYGEKW